MKTLEPTKIIHSEGGLPNAYKTSLGWCVVGPINYMNKKGITTRCNHVAVRDAESSKIASQHFAMELSVKDLHWQCTGMTSVSQNLFTILKCVEVSCEDKNFMEIVER